MSTSKKNEQILEKNFCFFLNFINLRYQCRENLSLKKKIVFPLNNSIRSQKYSANRRKIQRRKSENLEKSQKLRIEFFRFSEKKKSPDRSENILSNFSDFRNFLISWGNLINNEENAKKFKNYYRENFRKFFENECDRKCFLFILSGFSREISKKVVLKFGILKISNVFLFSIFTRNFETLRTIRENFISDGKNCRK